MEWRNGHCHGCVTCQNQSRRRGEERATTLPWILQSKLKKSSQYLWQGKILFCSQHTKEAAEPFSSMPEQAVPELPFKGVVLQKPKMARLYLSEQTRKRENTNSVAWGLVSKGRETFSRSILKPSLTGLVRKGRAETPGAQAHWKTKT